MSKFNEESISSSSQKNSTWKAWLLAARPRTLPLALASIILGSFLAAADGRHRLSITLLAILTAACLQILSNLANDYGDFKHGADQAGRVGPQRAVQSGLITPAAMRGAMGLFALLSAVSGLGLLWVALGVEGFVIALIFLLLGAAAIGAAVTYTAGSRPYGYAGFGDLAVLIFFGWVGTLGSYYLQMASLDWTLFLPATSCGLLSVAVLNVNNIRDLESDRRAGKLSIPVRLGLERARMYHWGLLATAVLIAIFYSLLDFRGWPQGLFLLSLPLLWRNGRAIATTPDLAALNPWLKQMVMATLAFVLLLGLGQLWAS
jgi:1,4-dihydroxy-2-naphthoate polyprenyltransferase